MDAEQVVQVEPLLVGCKVAAEILGISKRQFDTMERCGRIGVMPISPFGRRKLYCLAEFREWVNAGCPSREIWQENK